MRCAVAIGCTMETRPSWIESVISNFPMGCIPLLQYDNIYDCQAGKLVDLMSEARLMEM